MGRGRLRIYIGYAAGVGKTYAMLNEGRRRSERGGDVVVGFVETHGRPRTEEQIGDLEVVPRRRIEHRGTTFEEMDLDAILRRAPAVVLVDELAHTNVVGSGHTKRWEDVEELLVAGIDVISTLNIQHVESLNDVIERITGVQQRETIPDAVVRAAEQQELVDMDPYALRRRMAHGNVYPPERIDAALGNYFREGNLGALRELALLWMADRVDEALQDYMRERGIQGPWETRERILVGLAGLPEDETLIRRASRMAAGRGGELIAVHVIAEDGLGGSPRLAASRELVEQVGGRFDEVLGEGVPEALLDVARAENVTQIVLGAGDRSRWRELTRGSIVHAVIRGSGPVDVHVISQRGTAGRASQPLRSARPTALPRRRRVAAAVFGTVALVLLTVAVSGFHERLGLSSILLLYLTVVIAIAAVGGILPAVAAAVAASLAINWFFTDPIHTWTIAAPEHIFGLAVFVLVAVVVSVLVDRGARLRAEAQRGRAEAEALARLAARLAAEEDPLPGLVEHLQATFGLEAVAVLRRSDDGSWTPEAAAGTAPPAAPDEGTDAIDLGQGSMLVVRGDRLRADSLHVLAAFAAQLAFAVRSRMLAREAAAASSLAEVNELRTAILAAVSHDLRTPLASIKAAVSSLREPDVRWPKRETDEFLATIEEESDRLTSLVANLLDMSRLQTGALTLVERPVGLDEIVSRALASLPDRGRDIQVEVAESLPRIDVDAVLLERAVANIASNAKAWSPADAPVRIQGSQAGQRVELRVIDRGPGVPVDERDRIFQPFQRLGDATTGDGVGLGLAVARGFVEVMGGHLLIEDTPGGGLTMVIAFEAAA